MKEREREREREREPPTLSKRKLTFHTRTNHADEKATEKPSTQNWRTLGSAANPTP